MYCIELGIGLIVYQLPNNGPTVQYNSILIYVIVEAAVTICTIFKYTVLIIECLTLKKRSLIDEYELSAL